MDEFSKAETTLKRLPSTTIKLIGSAQVITSVSAVVKELMENSLDAGATSIDVNLDNHGLDRIEIRDNGKGIKEADVQFMCQKSYTSKISEFEDLEKLSSYGFRGEALFSLCAVSDVSVSTIYEGEKYAKIHTMNHNGEVVESKPAILDRGTVIVAANLFKNLPVRKQFLSTGKRKGEEMKKVEMVVKTLALINFELRTRLTHNRFTIWQKASVCSITRSFIQVLPPSLVKQLYEINFSSDVEKIKFTLLVPKQDSNIVTTCLGHTSDAVYLFVNSRPVREKQIEKAIHDKVFEFFGSKIPAKKYPAIVVSLSLPPDMIDVNLEPNKTKVLIKDIEKVIQLLKDQLSIYYYGMDEETIMKEACTMEIAPKRKVSPNSKLSSPSKKKSKSDKNVTENDKLEENLQRISTDTTNSIFDPPTKETNTPPKANSSRHTTISSFIEGIENSQQPSAEHEPQPDVISQPNNTESPTTPITSDDPFDQSLPEIPDLTETDPPDSQEPSSIPIISDDLFDSIRRRLQKEDLESEQTSQFFPEPEVTLKETESAPKNTEETVTESKSTTESVKHRVFDLAAWSRGEVFIDGKKLEGPVAIAGGSRDTEEPEQSSCETDRSVSSQMGQKNMSAFTKFAREMRVEIVKAQPTISFPKIAKELSKRWQEMQEEDKQMYNDLALAEKEQKKKAHLEKRHTETATPSKTTKNEPPKHTFFKTYPFVTTINVNLNDIKDTIKNRGAADYDTDTPEIVASLNDDLLIVKEQFAINVFSCSRLNESIKFYNNLSNMIVRLKPLKESIPVRETDLGELWSILESLAAGIDVNCRGNSDFPKVITDERITKNGFRIEKNTGPSGHQYRITDSAQDIDNFGLDDLKEILQCIANFEECRLRNCRPMKITDFIRNETLKSLVGQTFKQTDYTIDLYKHWSKKISQLESLCPHHQPVVKCIFSSK